MFFLSRLKKNITIYPYELDQELAALVSKKLLDLEGKIFGKYGYIVMITEFSTSSKGKIDSDTGQTIYNVSFNAVTLKLIKNETLFVIPKIINEHGFFCSIGPIYIFTSKHMLQNLNYDQSNNSWNNDSLSINFNDRVKIKILASRINANEITATSTI